MKTNIDWLRDFVPIDESAETLAEELTMAGLEVDSVAPASASLNGVVVAEILERRPHPDADRLSICRITDGSGEHDIVCGAPNAAAGIKVPFAPVGTVLPGDRRIESAEIRGVRSEGMLCSGRELGLGDDTGGLLVLDADAAPGRPLADWLGLDDAVLDVDLTPNRGDCFSVIGIARELAARKTVEPLDEAQNCIEPTIDATFPVELVDTTACPRFAGRVITGISPQARLPDRQRERLRRAGIRPIHPVVDVTNYVMLELGQPLHAYRLDKLDRQIEVRFARQGEKLTLLDKSEHTLDEATLVIADGTGAIGLAGIMGGLSTSVDATTDAIFLESAFFSPDALLGRARRYGLHTDASIRFERGVDPGGQERAIERATELLLEIAGGQAGPIVLAEDENQLPHPEPIRLRAKRVASLLGTEIPSVEIENMLVRLGMQVEATADGWQAIPPSFRFDIAIEEDLIEEIGRMIGYDRIPVLPASSEVRLGPAPETRVTVDQLSDLLVARGFAETVNFSFAESGEQALILGVDEAVRLANPITRDADVMRRSLWPGLLRAARLNQSHQLARCRLFEAGTVFEPAGDGVTESTRLAGLVTGPRHPEHWDGASPDADYFDLKGDVEALLAEWRGAADFSFTAEQHPALNPSRSAAIRQGENRVGWLGELHPRLQSEFEFRHGVVLFEIDLSAMTAGTVPVYEAYSRFPSVRRDLAIVIDESVCADDITAIVRETLGKELRRYAIFDVYRGQGVDSGRKSVAIGLILQNAYRTLTDKEIDDMTEKLMRRLEQELGATIRN